MPAEPGDLPTRSDPERDELQAEIDRLRRLVGPSELSYIALKTDLWSARDAVIGAQAELGQMRARMEKLEVDLMRATREQRWIKAEIVTRVRKVQRIPRRALGIARRNVIK
jgi:predicted  nucleic acid-binding Zn-ribbon protein